MSHCCSQAQGKKTRKVPKGPMVTADGIARVFPDWPSVNYLIFSSDDKMLAIGTGDAQIQVKIMTARPNHTRPPNNTHTSPTANTLCHATLQILDPLTGLTVCAADLESEVMCVGFSPDDVFVAGGTSNGNVSGGGTVYTPSYNEQYCVTQPRLRLLCTRSS